MESRGGGAVTHNNQMMRVCEETFFSLITPIKCISFSQFAGVGNHKTGC
jgi:hypothetical protein